MKTFAPHQRPPVALTPPAKPRFNLSRLSLLSPNARTLADLCTPLIQPKLTINQPGDQYEQEADRVVAEVMRSNVGQSQISLPTGRQMVGSNNGHTLSKNTVAFPTPRVGHSFSKVRVTAPPMPIQPKLTVNQPGDRYEQEADRVAEEVMRSSSSFGGTISAGGPPNVQKKCAACASGGGLCPECAEEEKMVQRKPLPWSITPLVQREQAQLSSGQNSHISTDLNARVQALTSTGGMPLPESERAFFEPRFGFDFSKVRIYPDGQAANLAYDFNARAFTLSNNIVFGRGEYAPETDTGRRLMAHELTHMVQQVPTTPHIIQRQVISTVQVPASETTPANERSISSLIVDDEIRELAPGQMRRSEFLTEARAAVCNTAEEVLASTGRSTSNCPYLDFVFRFFNTRNAQNIEQTLRRFAPEASGVTSAREYIPIITERVRQSTQRWVETGRVTGLPEGVPTNLLGMLSVARSEGISGGVGGVSFKDREGGARATSTPQAIQAQLGAGHALDVGMSSRMGSAFGYDFSKVRVHTDADAASLSTQFNARAFTVGHHVAFGTGEYQPGTLIGDALIAHELAHVVQQKGADASAVPMKLGDASYQALEEDADFSAVGAVASLWSGAKGLLKDITKNSLPQLKSGLRLQRCGNDVCPPGYCWQVVSSTAGLGWCTCHWECQASGSPAFQDPYTRRPPVPWDVRHSAGVGTASREDPEATGLCNCFPLEEEGRGTVCPPVSVQPTIDINEVAEPIANPGRNVSDEPTERRHPMVEIRPAVEGGVVPQAGTGTPAAPQPVSPTQPIPAPVPTPAPPPSSAPSPSVPPVSPTPVSEVTPTPISTPPPVSPSEPVPPTPSTPSPPVQVPVPGEGGGPSGGPVGTHGVVFVDVTGERWIVDAQIVIALDKAVRGDPLNSNERLIVQTAEQQGIAIAVTSTGIGELNSVSETIPTVREVAIPAAERQAILTELEQRGVGGGIRDRQIVTEALLAETAPSEIPKFATADRGIINGLARMAGIVRPGRYRNVAEFLHYERGTDSFTVTIEGRPLRVRPVQPIRPGL